MAAGGRGHVGHHSAVADYPPQYRRRKQVIAVKDLQKELSLL